MAGAFEQLQVELQARPMAGFWIGPIDTYLEIADALHELPPRLPMQANELAAFQEMKAAAGAIADYLGPALYQLQTAELDAPLTAEWQAETLRHLRATAQFALRFNVGVDLLDEALTRIPAALDSINLPAPATGGGWGLPLGLAAGGALLLGVALVARRR